MTTPADPYGRPTADAFRLVAPAPVTSVGGARARQLAPQVVDGVVPRIDACAAAFSTDLFSARSGTPAHAACVDEVRTMATGDLRSLVELAERMAARAEFAVGDGALGEGSGPARALAGLRTALDDARKRDWPGPEHRERLVALLDELHRCLEDRSGAQRGLSYDRAAAWEVMVRLVQYDHLAERLEQRLSAGRDGASRPAEAGAVVAALRARREELGEEMALAIQSYLVLDQLGQNDVELCVGLERLIDDLEELLAAGRGDDTGLTRADSDLGVVEELVAEARAATTESLAALRGEIDPLRARIVPDAQPFVASGRLDLTALPTT